MQLDKLGGVAIVGNGAEKQPSQFSSSGTIKYNPMA
jgi:hypothetical protein